MLALLRAALAAALLLLFVPPTHAADKAFQRNDLADAAIKLEAQIKAETQATIRNMPIAGTPPAGACVRCGRPAITSAWFAKAY